MTCEDVDLRFRSIELFSVSFISWNFVRSSRSVFFFFSDSSLFDVKQVGRMTRNTGAVWRLFGD